MVLPRTRGRLLWTISVQQRQQWTRRSWLKKLFQWKEIFSRRRKSLTTKRTWPSIGFENGSCWGCWIWTWLWKSGRAGRKVHRGKLWKGLALKLGFRRHMIRKHNQNPPSLTVNGQVIPILEGHRIVCPHCQKEFTDKLKIRCHIATHHTNCACEHCGKTFKSTKVLKVHIERKQSSQEFLCDESEQSCRGNWRTTLNQSMAMELMCVSSAEKATVINQHCYSTWKQSTTTMC